MRANDLIDIWRIRNPEKKAIYLDAEKALSN